jgi:hypothetical protein
VDATVDGQSIFVSMTTSRRWKPSMSNASAAPVGVCVNRGVHLHVAVAVKVHDHDHDHGKVNAGRRQRGRRQKTPAT